MKLKFTIFGYEIWCLELDRPWSIHIEPGDLEFEEIEEEELAPDDPRQFGWGSNPVIERDEKMIWSSEEEGDDFGFGSKGPHM